MPTNRSATRASPNVSRSSSRPGSCGLVPRRERRHAAEPDLVVVDERHVVPPQLPGQSAAPSSTAARPNIVASLLTITNEKPRLAAACAASTSPTAVPHGNPRAAVAAEQLVGEALQLGRARWQPARQREVAGAEEDRVEVRDIEDLVHLREGSDVFELHSPDRVLTACEVVALAGQPPPTGARRAAGAPRPLRWVDHLVDAPLRLRGVGDLGHEQPVGAGVEQALRVAAAAVGHPHQRRHLEGLRDDDRAVREVERERAVLHVDDDELEACRGEHLERLEARELDPGAERRGPGSAQPVGDLPHGIGYSSALTHPAGPLGEVEPRRSEDVDELMPHLMHALAGVHGRRRDHGDGRALGVLVVVVAPRRPCRRSTACGCGARSRLRAAARSARSRRGGEGCSLCRIARPVVGIEVVHHDRAAPQQAAEAPAVLRDRVERIDADAMTTGRIGPRLPVGHVRIGARVHVGVATPRDEVGGLRREEAHDLPARRDDELAVTGRHHDDGLPADLASLCPPAVAVAAASGDVNSTMYSSGWPLRVSESPGCDLREHDAQRLAAHVPRLRARGRDVVRREVDRTRSTAADRRHPAGRSAVRVPPSCDLGSLVS